MITCFSVGMCSSRIPCTMCCWEKMCKFHDILHRNKKLFICSSSYDAYVHSQREWVRDVFTVWGRGRSEIRSITTQTMASAQVSNTPENDITVQEDGNGRERFMFRLNTPLIRSWASITPFKGCEIVIANVCVSPSTSSTLPELIHELVFCPCVMHEWPVTGQDIAVATVGKICTQLTNWIRTAIILPISENSCATRVGLSSCIAAS